VIIPQLPDLAGRLRQQVTAGTPGKELLAPGSVWNLSATLQHCAQTVGYSVTGYPRLKPALYRATVGTLAKRVFLWRGATRHSLGAGIEGAPPLDPDLPVADAAARLGEAVQRFEAHTAPHPPHPAYGACSHQEFAALHAMHLIEHVPGVTRD
jgi:hypothetical protein